MNYLYIGILSIAAIIIIGLGIKLAITKANIKKKKEIAKAALVGSIVQIVMIGVAVALFVVMKNKGISFV